MPSPLAFSFNCFKSEQFAKEILSNNKIIIFLNISNHNVSMLAAQYLNSGIFPMGSKAGLVSRLAAASL